MGREIKRVALDFDWPLNKVWEGFVSPHYVECPKDCRGGYSETYRRLEQHVNSLMRDSAVSEDLKYRKVTTFLAGRDPSILGHDCIDSFSAMKKLGDLAGLPEGWRTCPTCGGSGIHPDHQDAFEAWEPQEPPEGPGYQVWETVTEGSPITPVFADPEELISWIVENGLGGVMESISEEAARSFVLSATWAPSMVLEGERIINGVEYATRESHPVGSDGE